jgi:myosin heavy chain 6/7
MQAALEQESKAKAEAQRMKKKLEADVGELETALEHANANMEPRRPSGNTMSRSARHKANLRKNRETKKLPGINLIAADRRAHAMQNALEEARTLLEQADRARRLAEQELG